MDTPHPEQLTQMITGYWTSQAIYAAAKLEIADMLKDGPRCVDDLATSTSTHTDALYRLLRALASVGIFAESKQRTFSLTPLAERLRSDVPGSQRALALMNGEDMYRAWGEVLYSVQTGKRAFDKVFGEPIFDFLSQHPAKAQIFDEAMTGIHGREAAVVLDAYDFTGINTLADIGGGNGSNISAILQKHPSMKGILYDLPHVIERAKQHVEAAGVLSRCQLRDGDFFKSVPAGANAYLLRHIIHDWDDDKSLAILRNCHTVMPQGGKLLVIESVIPPGNEPFAGKLLDLAMLLVPGGKERTAEEYKVLYEAAGFQFTKIVPTSMEVSVVEGVKC